MSVHLFLGVAPSTSAVIRLGAKTQRALPPPAAAASGHPPEACEKAPPVASSVDEIRDDDESLMSSDMASLPRSLWGSPSPGDVSHRVHSTGAVSMSPLHHDHEGVASPVPTRPDAWSYDPAVDAVSHAGRTAYNTGNDADDRRGHADPRGPSTRVPGITAVARRRQAADPPQDEEQPPQENAAGRAARRFPATFERMSAPHADPDDNENEDDDFVGPVHVGAASTRRGPIGSRGGPARRLADSLLRDAPPHHLKVFDGLSSRGTSESTDGETNSDEAPAAVAPSMGVLHGASVLVDPSPIEATVGKRDGGGEMPPPVFIAFERAPPSASQHGMEGGAARCSFTAAPKLSTRDALRAARLRAAATTGTFHSPRAGQEEGDATLEFIVRRPENRGHDSRRPWCAGGGTSTHPASGGLGGGGVAAHQKALIALPHGDGRRPVALAARRLEGEQQQSRSRADAAGGSRHDALAIPTAFNGGGAAAGGDFDFEDFSFGAATSSSMTTSSHHVSFDVELRSLVANAARYKAITQQQLEATSSVEAGSHRAPAQLMEDFARGLDRRGGTNGTMLHQEEIVRDDEVDGGDLSVATTTTAAAGDAFASSIVA